MLRKLLLLASAVLAAANTYAIRVDFQTYYGGERLEGSEVCFLPRSLDRGRVDGILATREMRCLPADSVLQVGRGEWYFYARNTLGMISPHRSELRLADRNATDDLFKSLRLDLTAAGRLDASALHLGPDERFFAWGLESADYQAPIFMHDEGALLVPAQKPVIPIVSRNGEPVWIGRAVTTGVGKTVTLSRQEPEENRMHVVAAFQLPTRAHPPDVASPPRPVLEIDGKTYAPSVEVTAFRFGSFNLITFHDVPRAAGTLRLGGSAWTAQPVAFTKPKGGHLFIESPLLLQPVE